MQEKGLMLVFLTAIISGFSIFINKFAVSNINPYLYTFLKNLIVVVFLFSLILFLKEFNNFKNLNRKQWLQLVIIGLVGGSIPFLLFFKGLQLTNASMASFIHKTMFIFVIILAITFLKEKFNKKMFIATLLILLGNYLIIRLAFKNFNMGDLLILSATLLWSIENIISKYVLKEINSRIVAFSRMLFGSLFILVFLIFTKNINAITTINLQQFSWLLITSGLLLLYLITWYSGLKLIDVSVATSILLFGSIITTFLNIIFDNAKLTILQGFGILVLLIGIILFIGYSNTINLLKYLFYKKHYERY